MIFVCDFFVISKRVYEEKISDLPLGLIDVKVSDVFLKCRHKSLRELRSNSEHSSL